MKELIKEYNIKKDTIKKKVKEFHNFLRNSNEEVISRISHYIFLILSGIFPFSSAGKDEYLGNWKISDNEEEICNYLN